MHSMASLERRGINWRVWPLYEDHDTDALIHAIEMVAPFEGDEGGFVVDGYLLIDEERSVTRGVYRQRFEDSTRRML